MMLILFNIKKNKIERSKKIIYKETSYILLFVIAEFVNNKNFNM